MKEKKIIKEKLLEVEKMLHSSACSEEEREYYVGMFYALGWVVGKSSQLNSYSGERI